MAVLEQASLTSSRPNVVDSRPSDWSPLWVPPPRFGTRRRPERDTYGTAAGILARTKLGRPLLPWQQLVLDVALEIDPATGRLA